jgi:hypothetical protein
MATVATSGVGGKKWGLIDRSGQIVIAPQYAEPLVFNEGLAIVSHTVYKWGRDDAGNAMAISETSYHFINRSGTQTIAAHWQSIAAFSQALAPVMLDGFPTERWSYIDHQGKYFVTTQFEDAQPLSEDLAAVLVNDGESSKWGYIAR